MGVLTDLTVNLLGAQVTNVGEAAASAASGDRRVGQALKKARQDEQDAQDDRAFILTSCPSCHPVSSFFLSEIGDLGSESKGIVPLRQRNDSLGL